MGTYTCSSVARGPSGHISRRGVHISYPQCLQPQSGDCSDTRANDGHLKALLHFRAHQELQGDSLVDAATWGKRNSLAKGMAMYTLLHINANRFPNIYGLESLQESYSNVGTIMGHNCPTPKFRVYSRALCVVGLLSHGYCSSLWMTCRSPEPWPGPISASHCCPLYAPFTLHLQYTTTISHKISAH